MWQAPACRRATLPNPIYGTLLQSFLQSLAPLALQASGAATLRDDRGFQMPVMAHQVLHHFEQVGKRLFAIDEIAGGNFAASDRIECTLNMPGRVMEAGFAGDFRI